MVGEGWCRKWVESWVRMQDEKQLRERSQMNDQSQHARANHKVASILSANHKVASILSKLHAFSQPITKLHAFSQPIRRLPRSEDELSTSHLSKEKKDETAGVVRALSDYMCVCVCVFVCYHCVRVVLPHNNIAINIKIRIAVAFT